MNRVNSVSVVALLWIFLRIGATAFGGLGAALALLERDLVDKRGLLTAHELSEALTYTKLLPGSTVVQVVAYLGYKLGGWLGSAVATVAFLLPAVLAMLLVAAGYVAATSVPALERAIGGLNAVVVGLLLATTVRMAKATSSTPIQAGIALAASVAGAVFGVNAALIVIAAGFLGVLLLAPPATGSTRGQEGAG